MKNIFSVIALVLTSFLSYAQGCSDAGICSIGRAFTTTQDDFKNSFEAATIFGVGEANITYISPFLAYTRKLNERISLSTKVTFSSATGDFGTSSGLGDAFLIGNYTFKEKNKKQWSALVGWKIPFNNSDLRINGNPLPLDYQSSLGTIDLFLGTNLNYKKWDFNAVLQIPIVNSNQNTYLNELPGVTVFSSTNLFERKSDALFRTTYTFKTTNQKFTFKPNVLFIYHLGEDSFENKLGIRETIKGSDGLTLNGNLISTYNFNKQNSIELSIAAPFVIRDERPDGLTRGFVLGLQYKMLF